MRLNRALLSGVLIVVALVVQVSVLARLQLPGAVPDLLLLVVLGLGLVYGPTGGCLVGFSAGLLADVAPPSDHAIGRYALVLCILGYAAGLARPESGRLRSVIGPLAVVGVAAVTATLLYAAVGALVGDTAARHVGLFGLILTALVYDVLLAPFVVPGVMALARRGDPDRVVSAGTGGSAGGSGLGTLSQYARGTSYSGRKKGRVPGLAKRP